MRQHHGVLRARSVPGKGATFEIELPVQAEQSDDVRAARAGDATEIPRNRRFLIVDAEPAVRQALQLHSRRSGCFADAVSNGGAALEMLATQSYGAIFLDLHVAELGGEKLFAELVERDPDHAGRVVFATGDLEHPPARQFLQLSGRPFVGKPFALSTVAALLMQTASR